MCTADSHRHSEFIKTAATGTVAVDLNLQRLDARTHPADACTPESQTALIKREGIKTFSIFSLVSAAFSHPPCSSRPLTLFPLFKHVSPFSASLPFPSFVLLLLFLPPPPPIPPLFHSALLIPPTIFSSSLGAEAPFQLVCVCVCEIGEGPQRERKKEVNICVYIVRDNVFLLACVCVCVCVSESVCLCMRVFVRATEMK